ncbi:MAG: hypothetical protein HYV04_09465 [Deltaproteobacteria bacterium]|nr:hypothetical protein [Deltaproteobacteria bacterium]
MKVFLKKGRERPVLNGHPWIFSGAIEKVEGDSEATAICDVCNRDGRWLARGLYSPRSQIRVRVLTWRDENIDRAFFTRRLSQAAALREKHLPFSCDAYRLVNGEGDFLPGLAVDRYGDFLVVQFFTAGIDSLKDSVADSLVALFPSRGIYERSEGGVREEEGLPPVVGKKPDSFSISAITVCSSPRWRKTRRFLTVSPTPGLLPPMPSEAGRSRLSPSSHRDQPWSWPNRISLSTIFP